MKPDYFIGLDLGQAADFSALAVLERSVVDRPPKKRVKHYTCPALKRWPLGTAYTTIVSDVAKILEKPPLRNGTLVIDGTGVGRPVTDMFVQAKLAATLVSVLITAGHQVTFNNGYRHVPKIHLVATLQVLLQERRLQVAQAIPETEALMSELQTYRVKITPGLHESYNARDGAHDDLILALALAAWQAEHALVPEPFKFVVLRPGFIR